jgi:outer membrane immunogenic protein
VNGGYGWSRTEVDPVGSILFCNPGVGGCVGNAAPLSQIGSIPASLVTNPKGGEFGGQVGYNYQFSSWVAGVEADLSWTNFKGSSTAFGFAPVTGFPADFRATTATASEQLRYFGTVRGRFG